MPVLVNRAQNIWSADFQWLDKSYATETYLASAEHRLYSVFVLVARFAAVRVFAEHPISCDAFHLPPVWHVFLEIHHLRDLLYLRCSRKVSIRALSTLVSPIWVRRRQVILSIPFLNLRNRNRN